MFFSGLAERTSSVKNMGDKEKSGFNTQIFY